MNVIEHNEITQDTLFSGDLQCLQNRNGYRFSIDAVLLAHFCLSWKNAKILDLGTGCGILGLILLYRNQEHIVSIDGLEYQPGLAELARRNAYSNGFAQKFRITDCDYTAIKSIFPAEYFSHIVCNPPFFQAGRGRPSSNNEAFQARHQTATGIENICKAVAYALKNRGDAAFVYPAEQINQLLLRLTQQRIQPKMMRFVYSYPEADAAKLVLLMCKKNGGEGVRIMPPLYIYSEKNGRYSEEIEKMYSR